MISFLTDVFSCHEISERNVPGVFHGTILKEQKILLCDNDIMRTYRDQKNVLTGFSCSSILRESLTNNGG